MSHTLESDRLALVPLSNDDLELSFEMFTDPMVVQYVCEPMSREAIRAEFPLWMRRGSGGRIGIWTIHDRDTKEKFGSVFLLPMPVEEADTNYDLIVPDKMPNAEIEVGYVLKRSAWGKGIATEACRRLLEFAFQETELDSIVATLDEDNTASIRVLDKAGLAYRRQMLAYGEESPRYEITRDEWARLRN